MDAIESFNGIAFSWKSGWPRVVKTSLYRTYSYNFNVGYKIDKCNEDGSTSNISDHRPCFEGNFPLWKLLHRVCFWQSGSTFTCWSCLPKFDRKHRAWSVSSYHTLRCKFERNLSERLYSVSSWTIDYPKGTVATLVSICGFIRESNFPWESCAPLHPLSE